MASAAGKRGNAKMRRSWSRRCHGGATAATLLCLLLAAALAAVADGGSILRTGVENNVPRRLAGSPAAAPATAAAASPSRSPSATRSVSRSPSTSPAPSPRCIAPGSYGAAAQLVVTFLVPNVPPGVFGAGGGSNSGIAAACALQAAWQRGLASAGEPAAEALSLARVLDAASGASLIDASALAAVCGTAGTLVVASASAAPLFPLSPSPTPSPWAAPPAYLAGGLASSAWRRTSLAQTIERCADGSLTAPAAARDSAWTSATSASAGGGAAPVRLVAVAGVPLGSNAAASQPGAVLSAELGSSTYGAGVAVQALLLPPLASLANVCTDGSGSATLTAAGSAPTLASLQATLADALALAVSSLAFRGAASGVGYPLPPSDSLLALAAVDGSAGGTGLALTLPGVLSTAPCLTFTSPPSAPGFAAAALDFLSGAGPEPPLPSPSLSPSPTPSAAATRSGTPTPSAAALVLVSADGGDPPMLALGLGLGLGLASLMAAAAIAVRLRTARAAATATKLAALRRDMTAELGAYRGAALGGRRLALSGRYGGSGLSSLPLGGAPPGARLVRAGTIFVQSAGQNPLFRQAAAERRPSLAASVTSSVSRSGGGGGGGRPLPGSLSPPPPREAGGHPAQQRQQQRPRLQLRVEAVPVVLGPAFGGGGGLARAGTLILPTTGSGVPAGTPVFLPRPALTVGGGDDADVEEEAEGSAFSGHYGGESYEEEAEEEEDEEVSGAAPRQVGAYTGPPTASGAALRLSLASTGPAPSLALGPRLSATAAAASSGAAYPLPPTVSSFSSHNVSHAAPAAPVFALAPPGLPPFAAYQALHEAPPSIPSYHV